MSDIKKHVGKIKSTEQRCVVVFMQIPDQKEKALIINTESLTPRYEQLLLEIVDSPEGQQAHKLGEVMHRRSVPETGRSVLEEFHALGLMRAESIDNIIMMPRPNTPFMLRDILTQMGELGDVIPETNPTPEEFNHHAANMSSIGEDEKVQMAQNFLFEAQMLESEANKKREMAYAYVPSLRPKKPVASAPATAITATAPVEKKPRKVKSTAA